MTLGQKKTLRFGTVGVENGLNHLSSTDADAERRLQCALVRGDMCIFALHLHESVELKWLEHLIGDFSEII